MTAHQLVADIGGTNARFALYDPISRSLEQVRILTAANYPELGAAIADYLDSAGSPRVLAACFAVACPATNDEISFTNSPWRFSRSALAQRFGFERLVTVNDFESLALAVPSIPAQGLHCAREGVLDPSAAKAIIGPGTGLGVSGLIPVPGVPGARQWVALAGEGGHASFAPTTDLEIDLLRFLIRGRERASAERVLSGNGLSELFEFLSERAGVPGRRALPAEITALGLDQGDAVARSALELFCAVLGGFAGDVALTLGARGGVYIGGGIVPRLLPILSGSEFIARFLAKGRLSRMLTPIPIFVILDPCASLLGAAAVLRED
jgi:glucokinase